MFLRPSAAGEALGPAPQLLREARGSGRLGKVGAARLTPRPRARWCVQALALTLVCLQSQESLPGGGGEKLLASRQQDIGPIRTHTDLGALRKRLQPTFQDHN